MKKEKAVVVISGGMDSTVALYWAKERYAEVQPIHFLYGSKHSERELPCARKQCEKLGLNLKVVSLPLNDLFVSSLLKGGENIPEGHYQEETMKSTVVPFRNGIMLSIAGGYAESLGYDYVVLGNHAGDHAIYPDCRGAFIDAMNEALFVGTYNKIQIVSPFCNLTKSDIVKEGEKLGVDFSLTYSCYKGKALHCGKCGTCTERKEAFQLAEVKDPTIYE